MPAQQRSSPGAPTSLRATPPGPRSRLRLDRRSRVSSTPLLPNRRRVLITDPDTWKLLGKRCQSPGQTHSSASPPSRAIETPEADIDPDEAAPETRLVADVTEDDDVRVVKDESGDVEDRRRRHR